MKANSANFCCLENFKIKKLYALISLINAKTFVNKQTTLAKMLALQLFKYDTTVLYTCSSYELYFGERYW